MLNTVNLLLERCFQFLVMVINMDVLPINTDGEPIQAFGKVKKLLRLVAWLPCKHRRADGMGGRILGLVAQLFVRVGQMDGS